MKLAPKNVDDPRLGLRIGWDEESYEFEIFRAKVELYELVPGGRSASFSFTFEGKGAKKRSFLIPMKLSADDFAVLTDGGVDGTRTAVSAPTSTSKSRTRRAKRSASSCRSAGSWTP